MTGGQMAPPTLIGQKATTCPAGRSEAWSGMPIKISEMLSQIPSAYYIERVSMNNTANIMKTKKAITKALKYQMEGRGFSLSRSFYLPDQLGMNPVDSLKWLEEQYEPLLPAGSLQR
jgi:2-oxoglutarate ferredoxin oxidoreductase subunit beta